jgi:phosphoribosyl 1,2-cyclic phosphodiesterase
MTARAIRPQSLDAILVSHEHSDHIQGVGVLARRYRLPVYTTPGTLEAAGQIGRLPAAHHFACGRTFDIGGLHVHPFSIPHDAADPAAFTISCNGAKIGIATDLGTATGLVREHLQGCRLLVIESNHDPQMLLDGPYPWPLKQRIRGRTGHLSNPDSNRLLRTLRNESLRHVVLAHLSETNNTPEMALDSALHALAGGTEIGISVALQNRPTPVIRT